MFSHLFQQYNSFILQLTGNDPVTRGLVSVWMLGVLTYIARSLPSKFWTELKNQITVSGSFIDDKDEKNSSQVAFIENWLITRSLFKLRKKNFFVTEDGDEVDRFTFGRHYIIVGFRIFMIHKFRDPGSSKNLTQHLTITTYGRSIAPIEKIVAEGKSLIDVRYYVVSASEYYRNWRRKGTVQDSAPLFLDPAVKKAIDDKVLFFRDSRSWYIRNNVPYKLTIVLYGPPGTGKSSLIRYISDLLRSDIYSLNLQHAINNGIEHYFREGRKGVPMLVAIEDFEKHAKNRNAKTGDDKDFDDTSALIEGITGKESNLDILLNVLQGVYPLDNVITVLTTNHIEQIDPALIRKGRTDLLLEVNTVGVEQVKGFFEYTYEQPFPDDIKESLPIKACDMYGIFTDHPIDPQGYIEEFREKYDRTEKTPKLTMLKG